MMERGCDIATDMQSKRIERKFDMAQNPIVTFETTQGTIEAELYPEIAPNTVNNFLSLLEPVDRDIRSRASSHRMALPMI